MERRADALHLRPGDHAAQDLLEALVLHARNDVLPAVGLEDRVADLLHLLPVERPAAHPQKVIHVGGRLHLQNAVHRGDQLDQVGDGLLALRFGEPGVLALPLQLVEDRVLGFLLPVEQEHVLVELGELAVRVVGMKV